MMHWDDDFEEKYVDARRLYMRMYFFFTIMFPFAYPIAAILISFKKLYIKESLVELTNFLLTTYFVFTNVGIARFYLKEAKWGQNICKYLDIQ